MKEGFFVNKSFEDNMKNFFLKKDLSSESFEYLIIELLSIIYDDIDILNPFLTKNVGSLYMNMGKFGFPKEEIKLFFDNYENYFLTRQGESLQIICFKLCEMLVYKNNIKVLNNEELLSFFELINKICEVCNLQMDDVKNYYYEKSYLLKNDLILNTITKSNATEKISNSTINSVAEVDSIDKNKKQFNVHIPNIFASSTGNVSVLIILITIVIVSFGFAIINYIVG